MFKSSSITLDDKGLVFQCYAYRDSYRWIDIDGNRGFCLVTKRVLLVVNVHQTVGWNFTPEYKRARATRAFARVMIGCDATMDPLGHNARELATLMTEYLRRAHASIGERAYVKDWEQTVVAPPYGGIGVTSQSRF